MPESYTLIDSLGNEITFGLPTIRIKGVEGLGMPDVRHMSEQYAQQDGETWSDARLQKRILTMAFQIVESDEAGLWDAREDFLRLVKVLSSGFKLRVTLPNGNVRQIDLRYDSAFTLPRTDEMHDRQQTATIQAVAHDPLWYDPTSVLWAFAVSGGGSGSWSWPLAYPAGWGGSVAEGTLETKQYVGTWKAYPIITLTGPMEKPVITNHTTGDVLEFLDGYQIDEGESVVIDLRPGNKTVTHSVDGNAPDALTDDSDLGTWHIAAHPEARSGNNSISVAFLGANVNSRAEIRFYTRYVGI